MSEPSASLPFDARPLTESVDRATAREYVRALRRAGRAPARSTTIPVVGVIVGVILLVVFGTTFAQLFATVFAIAGSGGLSAQSGGLFAIFSFGIFAVFVLIAVIAGVGLFRGTRGTGSTRWYRLDRFAQANGMTWYPEAKAPPLPGMIFGIGHDRVATDLVRGDRPRLVEFANYRYKTGSGKEETTHTWGYVALKLSTPLPHIVLDAVGNNTLFGSNLPASFDRDQRLSLEGDFDRHFALYCPQGYERDALYLFPPDIMARFIDSAAALDVEIVDDWLFLYTRRAVSTLDPATWEWLFSVVGALLDKVGRWERWRDDRLALAATAPGEEEPARPLASGGAVPFVAPPPPGVAAGGQRLRRRFPWRIVAIIGAMLAYTLLARSGFFAGIFDGFMHP